MQLYYETFSLLSKRILVFRSITHLHTNTHTLIVATHKYDPQFTNCQYQSQYLVLSTIYICCTQVFACASNIYVGPNTHTILPIHKYVHFKLQSVNIKANTQFTIVICTHTQSFLSCNYYKMFSPFVGGDVVYSKSVYNSCNTKLTFRPSHTHPQSSPSKFSCSSLYFHM